MRSGWFMSLATEHSSLYVDRLSLHKTRGGGGNNVCEVVCVGVWGGGGGNNVCEVVCAGVWGGGGGNNVCEVVCVGVCLQLQWTCMSNSPRRGFPQDTFRE